MAKKFEYRYIDNSYLQEPGYPGDPNPSRVIYSELNVDQLNELAEGGWRVVSVGWSESGDQMKSALLEREIPAAKAKK